MTIMETISHATGDAPCPTDWVEPVAISVPGHGRALRAIAHSMHVPVSTLVRSVLAERLLGRSIGGQVQAVAGVAARAQGSFRNLYFRMSARHAEGLTCAARAAGLSRGLYLARLMDGELPVPLPRDQRENWVALVQSTAMLAVMSRDLQALMRAMHQASLPDQLACEATIAELSEAVQRHLTAAAPLISASKPSQPSIAECLAGGAAQLLK